MARVTARPNGGRCTWCSSCSWASWPFCTCTSRGPKVFRSFPRELFGQTTALAQNQGLYNAFLAAGLVWALLIPDPVWQRHVAVFFLGCVAVAGVVGALTAERKILFVQTVPALLGLAAALLL